MTNFSSKAVETEVLDDATGQLMAEAPATVERAPAAVATLRSVLTPYHGNALKTPATTKAKVRKPLPFQLFRRSYTAAQSPQLRAVQSWFQVP